MSLLQSLGIDITVIIQFCIAATVFLILATAVFSAYQKSYLDRLQNTIGNQSNAGVTEQKIEIVKQNYEQRVKELNQEIAKIFEAEKLKAKEYLTTKQNKIRKEIEDLRLFSDQQTRLQIKAIEEKKSELVNELSNSIYKQLVPQR